MRNELAPFRRIKLTEFIVESSVDQLIGGADVRTDLFWEVWGRTNRGMLLIRAMLYECLSFER